MAAPALHLPTGWFRSGAAPQRYEMGVAAPGSPALIQSLTDRSDAPSERDFATLMQSISAGRYRDKRMRLSAELRAEEVSGVATIWMRVDGTSRQILAFDNMERRDPEGPLTDTSGWARRQIVLDVPAAAESIHFGFYLRGRGRAWARDFTFAEVGRDVPPTAPHHSYRETPVNLDFGDIDKEMD
jgi:hypothetical protein